jgi:Zn-dependent peptidase ImmA (M78 family)
MCALAQEKRILYGITTNSLNLTVIQRIYKSEGITIDRWNIKGRKLKAAYFCDGDCSVLINKNLPREPKLFALVHELKHHYVDQDSILSGEISCGDYNANEVIEIGAEVFAAEFIYPASEMRELASRLAIQTGTCTPEKIVEFKRSCQAVVSYQFLVKRFERFGFITTGVYKKIQFVKLEEKIYGPPIYKQEWYKEQRAAKKQIIQ